MKKHIKYISTFLVMLMVLLVPLNSFISAEDTKEILVLGNDLTPKMVQNLKGIYGIDYEIEELIVTNEEEHAALGKYISADLITTKSMSSAHIKLLKKGEGITVETQNINWVTEDMYINALTTAGIMDAEIKVVGPFPVSGTAALTGTMRAYEKLTGDIIPEEEKDVANEEMVTTAKLSDSIGAEQAAKIIAEVKIFIAENNIKDEASIKEAIESAAEKINITLSKEDLKSIMHLMKRISQLDLNVEQIKSQLGSFMDKLDKIEKDTEEIRGFLAKIFHALKEFFSKIFGDK